MPIILSIKHSERLIIAMGSDRVGKVDIETYLDEVFAKRLMAYAKLVDLSQCTVSLDDDDLMMLGARIRAYDEAQQVFGPLAIVVKPKDEILAALYETLAAAPRPVRTFTDTPSADAWLLDNAVAA